MRIGLSVRFCAKAKPAPQSPLAVLSSIVSPIRVGSIASLSLRFYDQAVAGIFTFLVIWLMFALIYRGRARAWMTRKLRTH